MLDNTIIVQSPAAAVIEVKTAAPSTVDVESVGARGLSAYQVAVVNGFEGTEQEWLDSLQGSGGATAQDTFETVSKNLRSEDATIGYNGAGDLETLTYADGIVKTLAYGAGGDLQTITLSGATPNGISLVKTLIYTDGNLTGVSYA